MPEARAIDHPTDGSSLLGTLVIPTLNEALCLPHTLLGIARVLQDQFGHRQTWEVLIADGGSQDNTEVVHSVVSRKLGLRTRWLPPPDPPEELSASLLRALSEASTRHCIIMDADGSHPPTSIPIIHRHLVKGAAIVAASRYISGGSNSSMGTGRRLLSSACARLSQPLLGLSDPLTGLAGIDLKWIVLPQNPPRGFKFIAELVRTNRNSTIVEIPLDFQPRSGGTSKLNPFTCYHFARQWLGWALSDRTAGGYI